MQADDVGLPQQPVEVDPLGAGEIAARVRVGEEDPRAKAGEPPGDGAAHVAEPDQADRQRPQLVAHHLLPSPVAITHPAIAIGAVADQVQDRHQRPVGHVLAVEPGRVGDRDPVLGRGAVIDGVKADGRLLDEQAVAHVLQHPAVDSVEMAAVADDEMGLVDRVEDGLLRGGDGHQRHLDLVAVPDQRADLGLGQRAEAGDPGSHAWLRLPPGATRPRCLAFRSGPRVCA